MSAPAAAPVPADEAGRRAVWAGDGPLGRFTLEPLDPVEHLDLLHAWITHPRSVFWQMPDAAPEDVRRAYEAIAARPDHHAWLGRRDGVPLFLAESYDPAGSELAGLPELRPGDVGMHLLVAPPDPGTPPVHGLTTAVMAAVLAFLFDDPRTRRVVVEPDSRNAAIARLNAEAGFVVVRRIPLPGKTADLAFCTREAFRSREPGPGPGAGAVPADRLAHLTPQRLDRAQRRLTAKALAEFAHELLVVPEPDPDDAPLGHVVTVDATTTYRFRARRFALDHWAIDPGSLRCTRDGLPGEPDVLDLVLRLRAVLGIPDHLLGTYLEELSATLYSRTAADDDPARDVPRLLDATFQQLEAAMDEGHPGFLATNGRIGFGVTDRRAYVPEAGRPLRLSWLAAHRDHTTLSLAAGLDEGTLYATELDDATRARFGETLSGHGLDPGAYLLLPVHPWQLEQRIPVTFAADLAARRLVPLGEGPDRYQAQQSIRTLANLDVPARRYVKTALAIQNMGFLRGLSPRYMRGTPAINDWVTGLVDTDPLLRECRFEVLPEVAAIGYTGDVYHRVQTRSAQQKMLAALWRESPVPRLEPGERAMTMAGLLHRDRLGRALVTALIAASGVDAATWLRDYLRVYLRPVLHCLLRHDLAFMPHGENVILGLRGHRPVRAFLKDIGEEVIFCGDAPLPAEVERVRAPLPDDVRLLSVFTDVFDGFLRYLAGILAVDGVLEERAFWSLVADCVREHAADEPALHARFDLFTPRFARSCLNRLQLRNTLQMVDLTDQAASLIMVGELENPLAAGGSRG